MNITREPIPKLQPRGIYLLPNLLTTIALFFGFYAIIAAMKGNFDVAAIAIFISMIADTLDGRVARMTNTQTAFGAQYDSLSDMVAFGVAPALLCYSWALSHLGKIGWLASFLFAAATALRLARFNTQLHDQDKGFFQGLPSPAAASVVASGVWVCVTYNIPNGFFPAMVLGVLVVMMAALMVSTIRFYSFKQIDFKDKIPFVMVLIVVLVLALIALDPPKVLFCVFFMYAVSGPVLTLWQLHNVKHKAKRNL